ncbi:LysM peptidoglycan-binding domain-containing protein [Arthrobacter sp. 08Y14]|uniref:LysM peptidoglycan-binding domain-containing protein n=1 Tax=Arthrobacter sp. 08Y14 TaxID=2058885 RepID=UPI0021578155|nr:LysM peptidoglycan-binding domain-containing protein [Arthrobacter sp. 08Y14]
MLAAAAALIVLGFFTAPAMASSGGPDVTRTVQVSVGAGESLWGLAQEFAPERDPRDVMEDIMELNNLTESRLIVGAQLYIPVER